MQSSYFVYFFMLWLVFFTILYKIVDADFDGLDYGLGEFFNYLVTVLRISAGDL